MKINGKDLEKLFSVEVLDTDIQPLEIIHYSEWIGDHPYPVVARKNTYGYSLITVELLVKSRLDDAKTKKELFDDCLRQISGIIALCQSGNLVTNLSDLEYYAELKTHTSEKLRADRYKLVLEFQAGARWEKEVEKTVVKEGIIEMVGTMDTPCVISIRPTVNLESLTITGTTEKPIRILHIDPDREIVIDGKNGVITCQGENKFGDYDAWEFPKLKPGENTITVDSDTCEIHISYQPLFL